MQPSSAAPRNRLARETSPYLLQHADNPVDWYPWGEEALTRARVENKPILLSIGYSACHWCHVMAHESFEDPDIAAVMNERFVNIKVDREERPDLDKIYQLSHQLLTQRAGGWPLTMFLSPHDHQAFFGGTYFPRQPRHGLPSFADLLRRVSEFYHARTDDIARQSEALQEAFEHLSPPGASAETSITLEPVQAAREQLASQFDREHGGFGSPPKFPHPPYIEFLLRCWRATAATDQPDLHALFMASLTLMRMAEGGLQDHVGGGFARYSVDATWTIPHFEKMLYDNAQLLRCYAEAGAATGEAMFVHTAKRTAAWLMREMSSVSGAFFSAFDADSEGEEGKFYVWSIEELRGALPQAEFEALAARFGIAEGPNFEGRWHLRVHASFDEVAGRIGSDPQSAEMLVEQGLRKLYDVRRARTPPARDEKILTAWNALTIGAMAAAGRLQSDSALVAAATRAVDFIRECLMRDGMLLAVYKDGARFPAYLDDHAFLLDATIELLQARWRSIDLSFAIAMAEALLERFQDAEHGGFFFTAHDHEPLVHRFKTFTDEALPAGNAIAARALNRLGLLLGETRYLEAAARAVRAGWHLMRRYPSAHTSLILALWEHVDPPEIVIIRGADEESSRWHASLAHVYTPHRLVFRIPSDAAHLPSPLAAKTPESGTVAYVCRGTACSAPIRSLEALVALA